MEDNSGLGIFVPDCKISKDLENTLAFSRQRYLQLICAPQISLKTVLMQTSTFCTIVKQLQKLAMHNTLTLLWVPGHQDIDGNEKADELARKGSKTHFVGPEPFCALPAKTLYSPIHMKSFPFKIKKMSEKYWIWFILNSQSKFQPPNPSIIASYCGFRISCFCDFIWKSKKL